MAQTLVGDASRAKCGRRTTRPGARTGVRLRVRSPLTTCGSFAAWVLCGVALASTARAQDPFQPGLRWRALSNAALPAVPSSVTFAHGLNFVWTASNGPFMRFQLFGAFESGLVPSAVASLTPANATGALDIATGDRSDAVFALVQVNAPDSLHRATLVSRFSALGSASSGNAAAQWTFDSGLRANGPARIGASADGTRVFVANWNGPTPEVRVDVLDAATGASTANVMLFAQALNEVCVAAGGTRAAIATGRTVWIVDQNANPLHQEVVPLATSGIALSEGGTLVAIGGARVRVLFESAGTYATAFEVLGNPGEIARRVALSRNGATLAIGWWNAQNGVDARFEVVDVATQASLLDLPQAGTAGGLQNAPEVVRVTPDGRRAAFGTWGDGSSAPDVVLYDRSQGAIVLTADLPGSVFALDIDSEGTRVAVGLKSAHANLFASGGEFRLYDTGESDTAVLSAPRPGGTMDVAAQAAGASDVAFMWGPRAPFPVALPGMSGMLALDRSQMTVVRRAADAHGRAELPVSIPNDPLLIGTYHHLQSAFLVNGVWSLGGTVLDVLVY